jgi:hypothetical protein
MIPLILGLRIGSGRKGFGLWLPICLVWLLLFVFFLLLLPLMAITEMILASSKRSIPIIGIFWHTLTVMTNLSGTEIHVNNPDHRTKVDISIY